MKTNRLTLLTTVGLSLAFFSTPGCAQKEKPAESVAPVENKPVPATPAPAVVAPDVTAARWSDIKDDTYDQRVHFLEGLKRLEAKVDSQIAELTAKRVTLTKTPSAPDWDSAMKEMRNSRSFLASMGVELTEAEPDVWNQKKDKVGRAWVRTQDAYDKVKSSTTN